MSQAQVVYQNHQGFFEALPGKFLLPPALVSDFFHSLPVAGAKKTPGLSVFHHEAVTVPCPFLLLQPADLRCSRDSFLSPSPMFPEQRLLKNTLYLSRIFDWLRSSIIQLLQRYL